MRVRGMTIFLRKTPASAQVEILISRRSKLFNLLCVARDFILEEICSAPEWRVLHKSAL